MTSLPPASAPPIGGWRVTTQQQQTRLVVGQSRPVDGFTVSFVTGYGVVGSVFVPASDYTAANVQAAIAAQVAQLDAVSALTHQSTV